MTNENLRMQFLSGVITEGQYKIKLQENVAVAEVRRAMEAAIAKIKNPTDIERRINNVKFVVYNSLDPNTNGGERPPSDFQFDDAWWDSTYSQATDSVIASIYGELDAAVKGKSFGEDPMNENKSLNESMIGGIVGIGAINQIPPREKTDYETAFEHFLGERYETKFENREQDPHTMNEADEAAAVGKKVEAAAEDKLEATVDNLSDEQKAQLRAELAKAGITANSKIEDVTGKLDESLFEGEGDTKQKVANALSAIGGGLMRSMLVPLIPLIVGHTTGTGFGGGLAITAGVAGALIALAKLLGGEKSMEEGKEVEGLNENVGSTIDKMLQTFEFSEKGNDEMIEFGNYLLSPEGPKNIARSIKGKLKGEGGENYFTSKPEELDAFLSKL